MSFALYNVAETFFDIFTTASQEQRFHFTHKEIHDQVITMMLTVCTIS